MTETAKSPVVHCPKCNFPIPPLGPSVVLCPVCSSVVRLAKPARVVAPRADAPDPYKWPKLVGLLIALVASCWIYVEAELRTLPPLKLPPPVPTMTFPQTVFHPDASPDECARVRSIGNECITQSMLRSCDDAGVMTEEMCGLGVWPCLRDACGAGARCCVPGNYDAAVTDAGD